MVGVAKDDLRLDLVADVADVASLNGSYRAYRHEDWGFYGAMIRVQYTCPGVAFRIVG